MQIHATRLGRGQAQLSRLSANDLHQVELMRGQITHSELTDRGHQPELPRLSNL
jgi:hypothetical protein